MMNSIQDQNVTTNQSEGINNNDYIKRILLIIFLTNLPALASMFVSFKSSIGWIAGSIASAFNFWIMAKNTFALKPDHGNINIKKISKIFLIRYLFLIVWSLFILIVVKPELIVYCFGLFTAQIAIFIYQFWCQLKNSKLKKYFRGKDE
ncbi:MAG: hypothetical protein M0Q94_02335 [Candidatus Cloacimonetes bacterium]|nr:hypothetical protein [Candidatus Cloacimonadota bacterium]